MDFWYLSCPVASADASQSLRLTSVSPPFHLRLTSVFQRRKVGGDMEGEWREWGISGEGG